MYTEEGTSEEQEVLSRCPPHAMAIENEEIYRVFFKHSHFPMLLIDPETGGIVDANLAACVFYGYSKHNLIGIKMSQISTLSVDPLFETMRQANEEGMHCLLSHHRLSTGEIRDVEVYSGPVRAPGKTLLCCMIHDITSRRQAEAEQVALEKGESISVLAGGVGHDFNNILTMILGNITLAKMYMGKDMDKVLDKLTKAEESIARAKGLTQQLLTFSRGGSPVKKVTRIDDLLRDVCRFVLTGTAVSCTFDIAPDLAPVEIEEEQITEAVTHILINSLQAMPQGGMIAVAGQNITIENATGNVPPGRFVRIAITDKGIGIPAGHLDRIFEACFTTKPGGSGLGLAVCYTVVKSHGGHVTAESAPGEGATLSIYLPAFTGGQPMERNTGKIVPASGGRVLVMDDEDSIRDIVGDMLDYHGYKADFAKNGDEALLLYGEGAYDVVILDLTVPGGLGGKETIRELLRMDPNVKAIVSSGYSSDPIMSNYEQYGFKDVIAKPYRMEDLGDLVRKVIAEE